MFFSYVRFKTYAVWLILLLLLLLPGRWTVVVVDIHDEHDDGCPFSFVLLLLLLLRQRLLLLLPLSLVQLCRLPWLLPVLLVPRSKKKEEKQKINPSIRSDDSFWRRNILSREYYPRGCCMCTVVVYTHLQFSHGLTFFNV